MARPRKARVEGAVATRTRDMSAFRESVHEALDAGALSKVADPVPGNNGDALARIVEFFRAEHADEWDAIALCPTQHGLDAMIARLK